jgi:hypothetical protein
LKIHTHYLYLLFDTSICPQGKPCMSNDWDCVKCLGKLQNEISSTTYLHISALYLASHCLMGNGKIEQQSNLQQ